MRTLNIFNLDINIQRPNVQTFTTINPEFKDSLYEGWLRHFANQYATAWSPNGALFITGSRDGHIKLFDAHKQLLIESWQANHKSVYGFAWSPDSQQFASAFEDGTIELWNSRTRSSAGVLQGHAFTVRNLAWHPSLPLLVSVGWDKTIRLWDTTNKSEIKTITDHEADVHAVDWDNTGSRFATAASDATVKVWSTDGTEIRSLYGANTALLTVAWSPNGSKIAAAGLDKTIFVWDAATGTLLYKLLGSLGAVRTLDWLTEERLVVGGTDKKLRIFGLEPTIFDSKPGHIFFQRDIRLNSSLDASEGQPLALIYAYDNDFDDYDHDIFSLALDPTRKKLVLGVKNGKTRIFEAK